MGIVYSAYDERLDRKVAIKLLQDDHAEADDARRAQLLREAQAMARLSHPHVVQVYEVGEHEAQLFIAMEYMGGGDLRRWMSETPRSWRDVIRMLVAAGRGLAAAHAAGLVHRDFKPENVLLDEAGVAKITDFGLTLPRRSTTSAAATRPSSTCAWPCESARSTCRRTRPTTSRRWRASAGC
jgi:serine/threonine protein kinase